MPHELGSNLLGIQVLYNFKVFFKPGLVWYATVLSQIHSSHIAQSKSKQELDHDVGREGEEGMKGGCSSMGWPDEKIFIFFYFLE